MKEFCKALTARVCFCNSLHPPSQRLSSYLLTTSDYGDSRPIRNGNGNGHLKRDKFCAEAAEDGDPDAICVLTAAAAMADLHGRSGECAPA